MTSNLGATTLRRRRKASDPMATYDALPPAVRQWIGQAAFPWSPASCRRVWNKTRAKGGSAEDALAALTLAEHRALSRAHPNAVAGNHPE
jgi:hypothetical protein